MKSSLALFSTLLCSTTFTAPLASPQGSSSLDDRDGRGDAGSGITLTWPQAAAAGLSLAVAGGYAVHLFTRARSHDPDRGSSGDTQAPSRPLGETRPGSLDEEYRAIDREIDEQIESPKKEVAASEEAGWLLDLLNACLQAKVKLPSLSLSPSSPSLLPVCLICDPSFPSEV